MSSTLYSVLFLVSLKDSPSVKRVKAYFMKTCIMLLVSFGSLILVPVDKLRPGNNIRIFMVQLRKHLSYQFNFPAKPQMNQLHEGLPILLLIPNF
jgi:hypothetical protein